MEPPHSVEREQALGVERAVTRWYARRQMIQQEIAALQARTEELRPVDASTPSTEFSEAEQQLANAQERLRMLGSCPRPMMG